MSYNEWQWLHLGFIGCVSEKRDNVRECWILRWETSTFSRVLEPKEQQLQVGEVPFLIYELEDEDAIGAFWEASSGAKDCKDESERRICPDDGKLSLSHKLLGMEWLISSHCFRLCGMQRVGLLLPLWANNHPKKLEHE